MALGTFAKKALSSALGISTENIDAAQKFADKLRSKDIDKDKGKEIIAIVSKYDVSQLNSLIGQIYDIVKK